MFGMDNKSEDSVVPRTAQQSKVSDKSWATRHPVLSLCCLAFIACTGTIFQAPAVQAPTNHTSNPSSFMQIRAAATIGGGQPMAPMRGFVSHNETSRCILASPNNLRLRSNRGH